MGSVPRSKRIACGKRSGSASRSSRDNADERCDRADASARAIPGSGEQRGSHARKSGADHANSGRASHGECADAGSTTETRAGIEQLSGQLDDEWTLEGLTHLLYNIPKRLMGLSDDAKPDAALKQSQRAFFVGLYQLICGSDTGPRMPTLFLSLGPERVKELIGRSG